MRTAPQQNAVKIWIIALPAVVLLAITMAARASFGLFVSPLNTSTGLGVATISLAIACSQLAWGVAQPFAGALADRYGAERVIALSAATLVLGYAAIPFASTGTALLIVLCVVGFASAGAGGNSVLLGAVTRRVAPAQRGLAGGIVGTGGPIGQVLFPPAAQLMIAASGWTSAMFALALLSLAALPCARKLGSQGETGSGTAVTQAIQAPRVTHPHVASASSAVAALIGASRTPSYWLVTAAFFVCGFHVSFLLTHMPGVIELCGLPASFSGASLAVIGLFNIASSLLSGLAIQRFSMKVTLAAIYSLRGLGVTAFVIAPKTETTILAFAVWMGLTYMATLPPTSGLITKSFGTRHLGTLLGVTMFAHQVGGFLGVWLGGIAFAATGGYEWIWRLDIALAAAAAIVCLLISEDDPGARSASRADRTRAPEHRPYSRLAPLLKVRPCAALATDPMRAQHDNRFPPNA